MSNLKNVQQVTTIKRDLESRINREIGFCYEVTTLETKEKTIYGQTVDKILVYVRKIGGLDKFDIERLEKIGLRFCYVNPIEITNTEFGPSRKGLLIVLEMV